MNPALCRQEMKLERQLGRIVIASSFFFAVPAERYTVSSLYLLSFSRFLAASWKKRYARGKFAALGQIFLPRHRTRWRLHFRN